MMSKSDIKIEKPPLFYENYNATERIIVNQGGTSSGKTYTIVDMLFVIAMTTANLVITVVGQDIPNLKSGAYRDAKNIWGQSELYQQWFGKPNESERFFKCLNGSIIEFKSYADEQDAKSGKRDYLFVNEANGISFPVYWQLAIRTRKKVYLDYNPTVRFWAHDELINKPDVKLIISDHRHNPFLTKEEHERIEDIKDPELFKVYARGLTGRLEGLIYTNWQLVDSMPEEYQKRYIGLDFGFTNHPAAIVDVRLSNGELWVDEIEYKTGLTNPDIANILKENGLTPPMIIVADCAEPKSIAEIENLGLRVEPSEKGKDSVNNGIDIVKRYKINITRRSRNIQKEVKVYRWKEDKNGNPMNEPIKEMDHSMDAIRYVALNKFAEQRKKKPVNMKRLAKFAHN